MRIIFNLPNRLIFTIAFIVSSLIFIFKVTPSDFEKEFYLAISFFVLLTILSGIRIRIGRSDTLKNTINALWNFETACAFCYGIYLFFDYTIYGIEQPPLLTSWARENPILFSSMSVGLAFIAIFRASISIAEIFKDSISKSQPLGNNHTGVPPQKINIKPPH